MKEIEDFLLLNGFKKNKKKFSYTNKFCTVEIMFNSQKEAEYYLVTDNDGCNMNSNTLNIYWLIGVLTYYGMLTKDYKQLNFVTNSFTSN